MTREHRYVLGKVDYNGDNRANCEAAITWELSEDGRFSMCAEIWQPNKRDCLTCGQCVNEVAAFFPHDAKAQRMLAIWQRYHLNDMKAGSTVQEQWLRDNPIPESEYRYPNSHYVVALGKLRAAGFSPDAEGYEYGTQWKREELPAEVVAEIKGWSA